MHLVTILNLSNSQIKSTGVPGEKPLAAEQRTNKQIRTVKINTTGHDMAERKEVAKYELLHVRLNRETITTDTLSPLISSL